MKQMTHVYAGKLLRVSRPAFDLWLAAQARQPVGVPFVGASLRAVRATRAAVRVARHGP